MYHNFLHINHKTYISLTKENIHKFNIVTHAKENDNNDRRNSKEYTHTKLIKTKRKKFSQILKTFMLLDDIHKFH